MKILFLKKCIWHPLLLVCFVGLGLLFSSKQGDAVALPTPDQCCRCHTDVCEDVQLKPYAHAPVLEKQCLGCHVKGSSPIVNVSWKGSQKASPQEIEWFAREDRENYGHWFELPTHLAGSTVLLMARSADEEVLSENVKVPVLAEVEPLPMSESEEVISGFRVVEVKRGIFLSARLAWKTDRLTDAQVLYGEKELTLTTALDSRLDTDHEILIMGLKPGKEYNVVAASRDVSGNIAMSESIQLSTHDFFSEEAQQRPKVDGKVEMAAQFYQDKGKLFGHFVTNYPLSLRLGHSEQPLLVGENVGEDGRPLEHLALTDPYSLNITVCLGCHPQTKGVLSHPIDIKPKAGMLIPADYKTIADGRVSCMTCHEPHASNNEYRLTKARRKDLCLGCHRNFG